MLNYFGIRAYHIKINYIACISFEDSETHKTMVTIRNLNNHVKQ